MEEDTWTDPSQQDINSLSKFTASSHVENRTVFWRLQVPQDELNGKDKDIFLTVKGSNNVLTAVSNASRGGLFEFRELPSSFESLLPNNSYNTKNNFSVTDSGQGSILTYKTGSGEVLHAFYHVQTSHIVFRDVSAYAKIQYNRNDRKAELWPLKAVSCAHAIMEIM